MLRLALSLAVLAVVAVPQPALAGWPKTDPVRTYADLTGHCPYPEGIAIDPAGKVYASSAIHFVAGGTGAANICAISRGGEIREIPIAPGPAGVTALLGELFEPGHGLYVVDAADVTAPHGRLLRVNPNTGAVTTLASGFVLPNGIAQDENRALFVTDSLQGSVTRVAPDGSSRAVWSADPLLKPVAEFPIGANGIAFDRKQRFLYVTNASTRRIIRIPVRHDGSAGPAEVFADGDTLNARQGTTDALVRPDGIMFDVIGNLYVCANLSNEVQVLSRDGSQIIARYQGQGSNAFDIPASLVFKERTLYVSNLSFFDGGTGSKVSTVRVPFPGLPLSPDDKGDSD